eukprot:gene18740-6145_t
MLWRKQTKQKGSTHHECCVRIPDTIVMVYSRPMAWYFTNKDGHIMKRNKSRLASGEIIDYFSKKNKTCSGIAAKVLLAPENNTDWELDGAIKEQYMTIDDLRIKLAQDNWKGVVQMFFDPKFQADGRQIYNHGIRAWWSPYTFFTEKRTNKNKLNNFK